jgi:hypothetical protein
MRKGLIVMQTPSWTLVDSEKLAQENKYTYARASQAAIAALRVGDDVKIGFKLNVPTEDGYETERMWVEIEMIDGSGGFLGRLQNQPHFIQDLKINDHVRFSERHIMVTSNEDDHPGNDLVNKYRVRCFASNKVLQDGEKVTVLFREAPQVRGDSGWRFFSGTETESYMMNDDSMRFVSLGAVLRCGDAFVDLLESPVNSYFELNPGTGQFEVANHDGQDETEAGDNRPSVH